MQRLDDVAYEIVLDRPLPGLNKDFSLYSDKFKVRLQDAKTRYSDHNSWDIREILERNIKPS